MSIPIIEQPRVEESTWHERGFTWKDGPGGFCFACDDQGNITWDKLRADAAINARKCLDGTYAVKDEGVHTFHSRYRHPRIGRCPCGAEVELSNFTNTCRCGSDYNSAGQLLAPREQWGEETGEHWSDCVGPFGGDL